MEETIFLFLLWSGERLEFYFTLHQTWWGWGNPADTTLAKWSKVTAAAMRCIDMYPSSDARRRAKHPIWGIFTKNAQAHSIMRKYQTNPNPTGQTVNHSTKYLTSSLHRCQGRERQRRRNCHRLVEVKEVWELNAGYWILHEKKSIS